MTYSTGCNHFSSTPPTTGRNLLKPPLAPPLFTVYRPAVVNHSDVNYNDDDRAIQPNLQKINHASATSYVTPSSSP